MEEEKLETNVKQNNKKQKKKFRILKVILVIIILLILAIAGFVIYSTVKNGWGVSGMLATAMGHDEETLKNLDELKVLILGVSTDTSATLTDTIIVSSYNPKTQTANLLSIPRDTFVGKSEKNANSYNKINALYQTDADKILTAVNDLTGLDLKYYIVVDTEALIELVDVIGGVEFDVPIDMDYDDSSQDLHIHLKAGVQTLDGEQAENLVRFRHNNNGTSYPTEYGDNDIGRMRTQREFLTQVAKQTIQLKNIMKIGEIVDVAYKYIETNIPISDVKDYIPYVVNFNTESIQTATLPGASEKINGLWFYKCNKKQTVELIDEMFEKKEEEIQSDEEQTNKNSEISIEIINASGVKNSSTLMETILKDEGYGISSTSETQEAKNTVIINNKKVDNTKIDEIKNLLNIEVVSSSTTSKSNADITIVIGKDYK